MAEEQHRAAAALREAQQAAGAAEHRAAATEERLQRLYGLLFARPASSQEMELAQEFLGEEVNLEKWTRYAQALLMGNEFVFLD